MKNKKKILITGGCGYVGTSLIDYLIKLDFEIICLDLMIYGDKSIKSFSKYNLSNNFRFQRSFPVYIDNWRSVCVKITHLILVYFLLP